MANIFFNCLTISGSTRGVADFKERNRGTATDESGQIVESSLSFNALVPYPVDLNVPFGGYAESLYHVLYSSDEEMMSNRGVQHAGLSDRRALAAYFKKEDSEVAKLAARYRANIKQHGHATFFTWYPDKWGPNHDLGDGKEWNLCIEQPSTKELVYNFDTNWGVPDGWLMTVAKLFPKLQFTLAWECPDDETTGLIRYRNGKQVHFVDHDLWMLDDDDPDLPHGSYIRYPEGPPPAPEVRQVRGIRKAATQEPKANLKKAPRPRKTATTKSKTKDRSAKVVRRRNR